MIKPMTELDPMSGVGRTSRPLWQDDWEDVQVRFFGRLSGKSEDAPEEIWQAHLPADVSVSRLHQVHGATVLDGAPGCVGDGDALLTDQRRLALTVVTADCVPVLLASGHRLAAVHAGWRGVVAKILPATMARLEDTGPWVAWIGPAIGGCCYEVGEDVARQVASVSDASVILPRQPRPHVDLVAAVEIQLRHLGIADVRVVPQCTRCEADQWWSYRHAGSAAGRNYAAIWRV